ncbi:hypothetical protein SAMN04488020_10923 [Palleronia marisminoris]|uniref:hypothetical protein n=1 Tax=Palleronia marisminoris TaxID=315423 RepID=UPI0008F08C24|nr:hypothetical protein [Palleronia marisminoris]SFH26842.1 hypothetical protein SAMN04488020_10923 [Palleronia marisminoris]
MSNDTDEQAHEQAHDQDGEHIRAHQEGAEALTPWVGWILAPAAWALHQGIGYAMVPWLCSLGRMWPYHALTGLSVALCAAGAAASFHALRRSRRIEPERSQQRIRMMALVGLMFSAAAFGGITVEYTGAFFIPLCASVDL